MKFFFAADDLNVIGNHKSGVEADAELTDDIDVLTLIFFVGLVVEGAGMRDDTEVILELILCHSDTVIGNRQDGLSLSTVSRISKSS